MAGPESGGTDYLWTDDSGGNVVMNGSLTANTQPPSPPGCLASPHHIHDECQQHALSCFSLRGRRPNEFGLETLDVQELRVGTT